MSAVVEQKQVWDKLQEENRTLRQQLVDLQTGRGMYVEIQNQRFELVWEAARAGTGNPEAATATSSKRANAKPSKHSQSDATPQPGSAGVLEEMLLDEFSSAMNERMTA